LDLTVIDETGARAEPVSMPDTVAVGRIAARLVQLLELPETGVDGQPLSYGFRHESTGRQIGERETLAQAGVNEHDVLRLVALALAPAQAHAPAPKPSPNETPAKPPPPAPYQPPAQTPSPPPETTVLSPAPPPRQPPRQPAVAGGRWSPSMAIALTVLAVALVGVAVAIVVSRGGSGAHALTHAALTDTVASSGSSATTGSGSGAQTTGETGEDTTSTAGEGVLPAVSAQQMESEIQQILRSWHEDVVQGDYRAAWGLLSQRKQAQEESEQGYAAWEKNQATLRPYLNPAGLQVSIQSTEPNSGVAQVDVTGMTWDKPGASCGETSPSTAASRRSLGPV
jgi:hypothetical protein